MIFHATALLTYLPEGRYNITMIISEIRKIQFLSLAAFVALTGCEVVDEARRQQKDAEPAMSERFLSESDAKNRRSVTLPSTSLKFLVDYAMTNRPAMVSAALAVKDARLQIGRASCRERVSAIV